MPLFARVRSEHLHFFKFPASLLRQRRAVGLEALAPLGRHVGDPVAPVDEGALADGEFALLLSGQVRVGRRPGVFVHRPPGRLEHGEVAEAWDEAEGGRPDAPLFVFGCVAVPDKLFPLSLRQHVEVEAEVAPEAEERVPERLLEAPELSKAETRTGSNLQLVQPNLLHKPAKFLILLKQAIPVGLLGGGLEVGRCSQRAISDRGGRGARRARPRAQNRLPVVNSLE